MNSLYPCTNPNHGSDGVDTYEAWWWTTHDQIPDEQKCVCLYPVHPDGIVAKDDDFIMPDLGQADIKKLPKEMRQIAEHLNAKYGADNMVALAMGEWAEKHGYKPASHAKDDLELQIKREILIDDFEANQEKAMKKWGYLIEQADEVEVGHEQKSKHDKPYKPKL